MARGYKDLIVWQKSLQLVILVYKITEKFPSSEIYGITSQIRRSAVSIPSNIAEGSKRRTQKDFSQFIAIASGSGAELETQLEISKRLNFGEKEKYNEIESLLSEVMRMLTKMIS
jgi:four helix bundle protein